MLWILYCEEAIINCDNFGEAMTFALAIPGEKKEKQEFVCTEESSEWKECSESRNPTLVVYIRWKLEFKVNQDEYL